jgi:hypothetical protein
MSIVWLLTNVMYLDRSIWPDMESWMPEKCVLTPATELAELTEMRFPNESESSRSLGVYTARWDTPPFLEYGDDR